MSDTDQKELETLRRMLATPPMPHKAKKESQVDAIKKKARRSSK